MSTVAVCGMPCTFVAVNGAKIVCGTGETRRGVGVTDVGESDRTKGGREYAGALRSQERVGVTHSRTQGVQGSDKPFLTSSLQRTTFAAASR